MLGGLKVYHWCLPSLRRQTPNNITQTGCIFRFHSRVQTPVMALPLPDLWRKHRLHILQCLKSTKDHTRCTRVALDTIVCVFLVCHRRRDATRKVSLHHRVFLLYPIEHPHRACRLPHSAAHVVVTLQLPRQIMRALLLTASPVFRLFHSIPAEQALARVQRAFDTRKDMTRRSPETDEQLAFVREFIGSQ